MTTQGSDDLLLPPRARLLHIGPPKTASTALQFAAATRRKQLLKHGVRYPGRARNHRDPIGEFVGKTTGFFGGDGADDMVPPEGSWARIMTEIEAESSRRIWFGHEFAAAADDAKAKRMVEALGPRTHVVITLRDYGSMLPSIWQQQSKAGNTGTFDEWIRRVTERPRKQAIIDRVHVKHDQGELVRRWSEAAGAENVTVVVLDSGDHGFVYRAFERMLGLPKHLLTDGETDTLANRSLSVPEIEMLRRLNVVARDAGVPWADYRRLIGSGAALRLQQFRRPSADEQRLVLPAWAAETVQEDMDRHVRDIAGTGARVVGDLAALARAPRVRGVEEASHEEAMLVPLDAAVEALAGMLGVASGRSYRFDGPVRAFTAAVPARRPDASPARRVLARVRALARRPQSRARRSDTGRAELVTP